MYAEIRRRLCENLCRNGVDVYIACTPANVYYSSGFRSSFIELSWQMTGTDMVVLPTAPELDPAIIVSDYCAPEAKAQSEITDIRSYSLWTECRSYEEISGRGRNNKADIIFRPEQYDPDEIFKLVRAVLKDRGLVNGCIGSDLSLMKHGTYEALRRTFPENELIDCEQTLYDTRSIKHPLEIDRLRRAAFLCDAGLEYAIRHISESQTLDEVRINFEAGVDKAQREIPSQSVSEKTFLFPHIGKGSNTTIRAGDVVKLDCGVKVDGYWSDICRHVCVGQPNKKQMRVHGALLAGFQAGLTQIQPGNKMSDIYSAALKAVRENGLPNYSRGHFGHSIGMDDQVEEPPFIGPNDTVLEPGMVICLEVPYYPADVGGFNIEDIILIANEGHKVFTKLSRDLLTI